MKKANSNVKKNFIYNLIYQILIMIIPLITAPYLARVIGADGVGTYSYTYSIVNYFTLLCMLGVNNYGNRTIAKARENKSELSKSFCSIYIFQLFMGIIMLIIYIIYVSIFVDNYKGIAYIQCLFIISAVLDINWLYFGLEKFKLTITRSTILRVFSVILIFIFIRDSNDLWKYTLIMAGTTVLSQLLLWGFVKKDIDFVRVSFSDIFKHVKPNLILFIPIIAVSIYKIMDKIMLGALSNVTEVGYYENAEKIVHIPLTLITALGTVMLPRMSNIISNGNKENINKYLEKSLSFVMFISLAISFGLVAIGYDFAPIYFGMEFEKSGILICLLAITLPFLSFANVLRTQYLIPSEKDKDYIFSVGLGAIVNLIMNIIFIPKFQSIGACFGTIAAEFSVMLYQIISVKNNLNLKNCRKDILVFLIKSLIMFLLIFTIRFIISDKFIRVIIQLILGCSIYGILNLNYLNSIINFKKYINIRGHNKRKVR